MLDYLFGGGQVVVGLGLFVAWWLALMFLGSRWRDKPLSAIRFAVTPVVFLVWFVGAFLLVLRGLGRI
jgi:hypothetical protein